MVDNNAKQFGVYLLAQALYPVVKDAGDQTQYLTQLSTIVPGLDVSQYRNKEITREVWVNQIFPKIVDHCGASFEPGKLKATA